MQRSSSGAVHKSRRALLASGVAALALGMLPSIDVAAQAAQKVRFTLDWAIEGPSAPFIVAAERGYFSESNVNVVYEPGKGSTGALAAVADGRFDMGIADLNALIEYKGKKPDAPVLAVYIAFNGTPASIVTLRRSDYAVDKKYAIASVQDLKGKTLGGPGFDAARKMWPMFAKANNMDPGAVKWIDVSPARRESDLMMGRFDAISGFHYTSQLNLVERGSKQEEIVTFRFVDHGVQLYGNAIIVNTKFAEQNPQAVRNVVRAFNRGLRETIVSPKESLRYVMAVNSNLSAEAELERLNLALKHNIVTKEVQARGLGDVHPDRLASSINDLVATFKLPNTPASAQVFTDKYLPPAKERAL